MTNDKYTKLMLTIIALCLLVLAGDKIYQGLIPTAEAGRGSGFVPCWGDKGQGEKWQKKCMVVVSGKYGSPS